MLSGLTGPDFWITIILPEGSSFTGKVNKLASAPGLAGQDEPYLPFRLNETLDTFFGVSKVFLFCCFSLLSLFFLLPFSLRPFL
ncbi:hypothetical protein HM1_0222 [Heliomicrobium modesticaldum Ice1]|uniref:Uncharacterized protein n=1 Tax=Heliobacterium modesticaldum (strain ATCC 51547 / Ice1) TaxID=498761 RepID=B0TDX8_HELMI|nr:hypothetical protein HM1_0222 [Heliomicrobium modesticaldum Ice1]